MEKKLAMRWVKALRSGKFKQTKERLRKESEDGKVGYCCLGVLATICKVDKEVVSSCEALDAPQFSVCGLRDSLGGPSENDGIKVRNGWGYAKFDTLAEANDGGSSFRAIATWIEKNYSKL